VSDLRGLNVYSPGSGEWIVLDQRYTRPMLLRMQGNLDSTFTALHNSIEYSEDQRVRLASYRLYLWTSPTEEWCSVSDLGVDGRRGRARVGGAEPPCTGSTTPRGRCCAT
jgi:hypothetical protein